MNLLLIGMVLGVIFPMALLWVVFSLKEALPKAIRTYVNSWKLALKIRGEA